MLRNIDGLGGVRYSTIMLVDVFIRLLRLFGCRIPAAASEADPTTCTGVDLAAETL